MRDHAALARRLIDENDYMTLATADERGRPWASPVFYAAEMHTRFYWVSSPEARHSRHIAARREVSIVIFDSRARIGSAQAVYANAIAQELTTPEAGRAIELVLSPLGGPGRSPLGAGGRSGPCRASSLPRERMRVLGPRRP